MSKNIIINSSPCANASDIASYLESEFGLFHVDFSSEFEMETGLSEKQAIAQYGYERYSSMRSEVVQSLKANLTQPSVIVLVANSVCVDEIRELGYLYALEMSEHPPHEVAEHIFDMAAEYFCEDQVSELLAA